MKSKKNEETRAMYNRLIAEKETNLDDLKKNQRKIEDSLHMLQDELQRGYRTLAMLNEEDNRESGQAVNPFQRRSEQQEQFYKRKLTDAEDQLSDSYSEQRKLLDEETEELYQKRSELPWD